MGASSRPSPLPSALHADEGVVAQRRQGVVRRVGTACAAARRLCQRQRTVGDHARLHDSHKTDAAKSLRWTESAQTILDDVSDDARGGAATEARGGRNWRRRTGSRMVPGLARADPSEHLTQLVSRRAASQGVAGDEAPGELPHRRQSPGPVVELLDADVDMSRPSGHAPLV